MSSDEHTPDRPVEQDTTLYADLTWQRDNAEQEVERLRQWKAEALPVMAGLQDLGDALGVGLGERITGEAAAEKARALVARATSAEQGRDDLVARVQRQVDSAEVVKVHAGGGNLVTQRRMVDADTLAALLARSGEQPGGYWIRRCAIHDGERDDTCRVCNAEGTVTPAPVVPDDCTCGDAAESGVVHRVDGPCVRFSPKAPSGPRVVREAESALIGATKGDDPTAWAGTGWWHVHRLLSVVGQGVTAAEARAEAERRFQHPDAGAERSLHHWFTEGALWASAVVRSGGQEQADG